MAATFYAVQFLRVIPINKAENKIEIKGMTPPSTTAITEIILILFKDLASRFFLFFCIRSSREFRK